MPTTYVTKQGEMVDAICRRHYGDESGFVEKVLDINHGLAKMSALIPIGTAILLPDLPAAAAIVPVVKLWD